MKDKQSSESRRKLLKSIAAGSGAIIAGKSLPESWAKPVVDSVMLPAHAQTSVCALTMEVYNAAGAPIASGTTIAFNPDPIPQADFRGTVSPSGLGVGGTVSLSWSAPDGSSGQTSAVVQSDGSWSTGLIDLDFGATGTATTYVATIGCAGADATWNFIAGAPVNCLAHDTPILTPGNRYRKIASLNIGDMVTAIDRDGASIYTVVTKVITHHIRSDFYTINGNLRITDDHPVLVARGQSTVWCRVDDLIVGDHVRSLNGYVEVTSLDYHDQPLETVYVETQSGNFIAMAGSQHYVVKSDYAEASERLENGEERTFA